MNPRAKPQTDWGGTIQKFATGVLAVAAIVGAIVWAVVGPRIAKIENLILLGIRDKIDLIAAIKDRPGPDRDRKLDALLLKMEQESRMLEGGK